MVTVPPLFYMLIWEGEGQEGEGKGREEENERGGIKINPLRLVCLHFHMLEQANSATVNHVFSEHSVS